MCQSPTGALAASRIQSVSISLSRPLVLLLVVVLGNGGLGSFVMSRLRLVCCAVSSRAPVHACVLRPSAWTSLPAKCVFGLQAGYLWCDFLSLLVLAMAEVPAARRRRARGEEGEQHRAVRARVDEAETRLDSLEAALQRHETRLQFSEAPFRVVLRGFKCVAEFLRLLRSHDLRAAKTAFIPSFVDELKEQSRPEVTHLIEEAENLLVGRQGWVLLGVFPTGGNFNDTPDGLMRLQPGYAGSRMSHVLVQANRYLADTHQLFQDRVRRPHHGEKGGG